MRKLLFSGQLVPTVNFHLWQPCNMRCRFCFATFLDVKQTVLPKGHLTKDQAMAVTEALCESGISKITFVGGEPTLCPWLGDMLQLAKQKGVTTMLVTNGSRLTTNYLKYLKPKLDWLCLSIDSLNPLINEESGRKIPSKLAFDETYYRELVTTIKSIGFRFKINTVVHALNYTDDISAFIKWAQPERWKLFRVLPVEGQNGGTKNEMLIKGSQFKHYVNLHKQRGCNPVAEDNEEMRGSYAMVDPSGRFYDSSKGYHTYSNPILEVGVFQAYSQVNIDNNKFNKRGGIYNW